MNFARRTEHQRNENLELLLNEVNTLLAPVEKTCIAEFAGNEKPVVFVMGAPRSGTTLFLQWLASLGCFGYPSNILSRFYEAPYIGAKIQLMLTKHDFNNEIFDFNETVQFASRLGKTKGALAPNEFWYFWRRFFHFGEIQKLNDSALQEVDSRVLVAEFAALEHAFGKPFALKAMIMNWNIPFLNSIMPKALFVHVRRDPLYNVQSLLRARLDYYGDMRGWYSFKPPEYEMLRGMTPIEQVCGQIHYTNQAVVEGFAQVADERKITVGYEDFCENPADIYRRIREKLQCQGTEIEAAYSAPAAFDVANRVALSPEEVSQVSAAIDKFSSRKGVGYGNPTVR